MPSPDVLATIAMVAAVGLAVLAICRTEPGSALNWPIVTLTARAIRGRRYHRAGKARHAQTGTP